ncbi:hypothetical protein ATJ93_1511 [Halopiger aswanensis]|uniref:Uncharacterized protein n=2 Tax=Halopiger aswanensis TaxID=148449 RepID=A0A419WH36_9EURY|nr:hypothetical protein ATJ93_1511 [Halopiger aswanensis]
MGLGHGISTVSGVSMSDSSATSDRRSTSSSPSISNRAGSADSGDDHRLERAAPTIASSVRKTCFWGAILLPFLHVPLLLTGLATPAETAVFFGLLTINFVALYVGHAYEKDTQ